MLGVGRRPGAVEQERRPLGDVSLAGAFAGPELFRTWLLEEEHRGRPCVGVAGYAPACPLATFAREVVGVEDVYVGPSVGPLRPAQLLTPREELTLPEWCAGFIDWVDAQFSVAWASARVSPRQALDLLESSLDPQAVWHPDRL